MPSKAPKRRESSELVEVELPLAPKETKKACLLFLSHNGKGGDFWIPKQFIHRSNGCVFIPKWMYEERVGLVAPKTRDFKVVNAKSGIGLEIKSWNRRLD